MFLYDRRKFRSQTSDNMDRWKSRGGKSQRREDKKKEDPGARKGRKVAKHCVFQWFVAPGGRKVGSLKRRVRSQLARWEMKNCTPLWREAHFEVKMYKTHLLGPLLEAEMSKKCTPLWREAHFEVKMLKTPGVRTTFGGSGVASPHYTTWHYTTLHYTTTITTQLHSTTLHYTPLH